LSCRRRGHWKNVWRNYRRKERQGKQSNIDGREAGNRPGRKKEGRFLEKATELTKGASGIGGGWSLTRSVANKEKASTRVDGGKRGSTGNVSKSERT